MSFSITILGSGSALPTSDKFPPAHLLKASERFFLIDCGEGTQIQLRKNRIRFGKINRIFISHLHGDHVYGLFGLISSFSLLGRETDLHLYVPAMLERILDDHTGYFGKPGFRIVFHALSCDASERIFEDDLMTVDAFPLDHRVPACGFYFREKERPLNIRKDYIEKYDIAIRDIVKIKEGADLVTRDGKIIKNKECTLPPYVPRSYAYCSDTKYSESIVEHVKEVDVLFHEATFAQRDEDMAAENHHSTTVQAARIARKAKAGKLLIGHFSSRYKNHDILVEEARKIFPNTFGVRDGEVYGVRLRRTSQCL